MLASKFKTIVQEHLNYASDTTNEEVKALIVNAIDTVVSRIGDHSIPSTYTEYRKLLENKLYPHGTMEETEILLTAVPTIIKYKNGYDRGFGFLYLYSKFNYYESIKNEH